MSSALFEELDNHGCAPTGQLLTASECAAFAAMWDDDQRFRSTIDMERYRFGRGVYRYNDNPLPPKIAALRAQFYRELQPLEREWAVRHLWGCGQPAFPGATSPDW